MSARRRPRGAWLAGARDGDDVLAGRPLRDRAEPVVGRYFDDDEPAPSVVRASRSRRDGWNRHVVVGAATAERPRSRVSGRAARTVER